MGWPGILRHGHTWAGERGHARWLIEHRLPVHEIALQHNDSVVDVLAAAPPGRPDASQAGRRPERARRSFRQLQRPRERRPVVRPCVSVSRLDPAPSEPVGFGGEQLPVVSLNCGNGVQDAGPDSDATGAGACETPVADDRRRSAEICCHLRHGPVVDCHVDPPIAPSERNDVSGYRGPDVSVRSTVRSTDCAGT